MNERHKIELHRVRKEIEEVRKEIEDMIKEDNEKFEKFYEEHLRDAIINNSLEIIKPPWSSTIRIEIPEENFISYRYPRPEIYSSESQLRNYGVITISYIDRYNCLRLKVILDRIYYFYTNNIDEIISFFKYNRSEDKIRLLKYYLKEILAKVIAEKI